MRSHNVENLGAPSRHPLDAGMDHPNMGRPDSGITQARVQVPAFVLRRGGGDSVMARKMSKRVGWKKT